jgi:hypothetical protein
MNSRIIKLIIVLSVALCCWSYSGVSTTTVSPTVQKTAPWTNTNLGTNEIVAKSYTDMIGDTPLLELSSLVQPKVEGVRLFGKAEFMNPGFSMKDRMVSHVLKSALASGDLKPGGTVVAASSGMVLSFHMHNTKKK